ncbi:MULTISPECIES: 3-hydroxyacyl-CoA dehydrogenase family protein [unclassified Halorhabdus]|uniref:3-hydroxyacyl-CoA dehydrogenase family protein n=1 Tax=unclassified Halorhabdus TaxID=2621901 RepID=UPI0023DAD922|nr:MULTISPECIES: 3-hydroxyacyl-CoA dehydrogenase family protein [unclassified Halorhabdus]WEL17299.1 3-hydroxyacyl-CoA dehydrogenase [Halorhabdus sp. SVX81]WEL21182.1 3-hydroxyacyl-CoA dehydrogenase [Halorhabdus sp. BNX81]
MDVAILGTGAVGQRFARACLFGDGKESSDTGPGETGTVDTGDSDAAGQSPAVTLYGSDASAVMDAVDALEDALHNQVESELTDRLDRVDGTTDLDTAVGDADIVIETRADDLETVRRRLAGVEERLDDGTTIAIQADVADPTAAAAALENPERAIGLSMVVPGSPAQADTQASAVIEVVRAVQTDDAAVDTTTGFFDGLGWTPVVVNDAPGRISSRLQLALEAEAMRAVEADVAAPAAIDAVIEGGFGHAEGPLAAADRAGLDNRLETLDGLAAELGERFEPPAILRAKVQAGELGEKTGSGFREWEDDQPVDEADSTVR